MKINTITEMRVYPWDQPVAKMAAVVKHQMRPPQVLEIKLKRYWIELTPNKRILKIYESNLINT